MGRLTYVNGVMDAGKTNILLTRAHAMEERGYSLLTVKHGLDVTTKGKKIRSRIGLEREADIILDDTVNLREEVKRIMGGRVLDHVLGEEGQFWTPAQVEQSFELAVDDDVDVTVFGLRSDFRTRAFPASIRLFELAHSIETIEAPCRCKSNLAAFNCRKVGENFVFEGDQVAVDNDGDVTYESLCGSCYQQEKTATAAREALLAYEEEGAA